MDSNGIRWEFMLVSVVFGVISYLNIGRFQTVQKLGTESREQISWRAFGIIVSLLSAFGNALLALWL